MAIDSTVQKTPAMVLRGIRQLRIAAFLLGFGLGGFIDAIALHMILQWHHIISNLVPMDTLADLQINVWGDGIFSAGMWLITVIGLGLLWNALKQNPILPLSTQAFIGWIVVGWGGFNTFDSIVFHAILKLHHIRQVPNFLVYDISFFILGLLLIAIGFWLTREKSSGVS
uniref:DUF2243 domain-containing protein n=1 Tax=Desertifilum tharense IPPAS B-1220 TaxID=1781255 RepID=A0ACD5GNJ8_9CYAN